METKMYWIFSISNPVVHELEIMEDEMRIVFFGKFFFFNITGIHHTVRKGINAQQENKMNSYV